MTEAAPEIFLIGLGEIGASIGLALRESGAAAQRIGYDPDGRLVREAVQTGAIDRPGSFPGAARGADLIVLSLPAPAVPDALDALAPRLKPDAVVLDTALPRTAAAEHVRAGWPAAGAGRAQAARRSPVSAGRWRYSGTIRSSWATTR